MPLKVEGRPELPEPTLVDMESPIGEVFRGYKKAQMLSYGEAMEAYGRGMSDVLMLELELYRAAATDPAVKAAMNAWGVAGHLSELDSVHQSGSLPEQPGAADGSQT